MFRFASPYFLIMLFFLPGVVYYRFRACHPPVIGASSLSSVFSIKSSLFLKLRWVVPLLKYLAFALIVLALARPQWGTRQSQVLSQGINIVIALDLSNSMAALDFKKKGKIVNRLEAVKGVVDEFISKRDGDRMGLVVFGTHAYTQLPLTRDYQTILSILERLEIGAAGKSTAIGDAIGISLKRLEDIESKSNVIILLTDGQSNSGEIDTMTASNIAVQRKVKIYTIGVGSKGRAPFLINDPVFGERYVYQRVDIDEEILEKIASATGGLYFRAQALDGLKKIYDTIDKLEKTEVKVKTYDRYNDLYAYFIIPALIILGLWVILTNTRYLRVP